MSTLPCSIWAGFFCFCSCLSPVSGHHSTHSFATRPLAYITMWSDALFDEEFGLFSLDSNIGPDALWNSFESFESLISDETLLEALEETSLFDPSPVTSSTASVASTTDSMDCNLHLRASSHSSFSTNNSKDCASLVGKQLSVLGKRRKLSQHPTSMNMMKKKKKKKNKCISLLASPSVPIVQQRSQRERDSGRETNLRGKNDTRIINRDTNNNSTIIVSSNTLSCTSSTKCQISSNSSNGSATNSSPRSSYSKISSSNSSTFTISMNRDHDYWNLNWIKGFRQNLTSKLTSKLWYTLRYWIKHLDLVTKGQIYASAWTGTSAWVTSLQCHVSSSFLLSLSLCLSSFVFLRHFLASLLSRAPLHRPSNASIAHHFPLVCYRVTQCSVAIVHRRTTTSAN